MSLSAALYLYHHSITVIFVYIFVQVVIIFLGFHPPTQLMRKLCTGRHMIGTLKPRIQNSTNFSVSNYSATIAASDKTYIVSSRMRVRL
jgi:hypothetical protein